jgi:diaminopimelate decarboxylase
MEYSVAKNIGVESQRIFYNGPYKNPKAVKELLLDNGIVNIDSNSDLSIVSEIAKHHTNKTLRVGLRCNFNINDGVLSRFGFDLDNGDFEDAIKTLAETNNINLCGFHCHFASRNLEAWENASNGMLKVVDKFVKKYSLDINYISLGGGLYGQMDSSLEEQLDIQSPSFLEYAEVAAKPFNSFFKNVDENKKPTLIIEPGTALAANAVKFVSKVISIKTVNKKNIATMSGSSFNTNPNSNKINLPIKIYSDYGENDAVFYNDLDMAGYTCIESDYLYRNYKGNLSVGDSVVFDSAGSYSVVMKPPFILPNVPIIEICDNQVVNVIKRQETFKDIFQTYKFNF